MLVSVTSKGQLTLPKGIREKLGLVLGSKLDFSIDPDGSLRARPLRRGAADLFGMLHDPDRVASTVRQMDEAVGQYLARDDKRISSGAEASVSRNEVHP